MAQVILTSVGTAIGGPIGGAIGGFLGAALDRSFINALTPPRQIGPRLEGLSLQTTAEGGGLAAVFGHVRVFGQVIWAARFRESRVEGTSGGGKGGGPKTVDYRYSLSFAIALCEGPIDGMGRIWADGEPFILAGGAMRLYLGDEDQTPDPLITAIEGEAPAYRGVAYVVFEDLPLDAFGNRLPQFSFEIFNRPRGADSGSDLEERLTEICMIPGAGEFMLADAPVLRRAGLSRLTAENVNNITGLPDFELALDQLATVAPNLETITLVTGWFGDDLRCGACKIRPGVESFDKQTSPISWSVQNLARDQAHLISTHDGSPAYGGTPSDQTVLAAIAAIKARGYKVGLYPFLFMDLPAGNGLADPHGGPEQAAYPWRGRITCHPAAGQPGSPDKTSTADTQVVAFFGSCSAGDFSAAGETISYSGPDEWGFRRFILHYAKLAELADGVDLFIAGSEMIGLTTIRSSTSVYPAVAKLQTLLADCKGVLPGAQLSYSADWSEYFGHQPTDGSGDVHFHLDPLWADSACDFVGIDYYPPLADWRDGSGHLDALAGFKGPHQRAYIAANIEAGPDYDWFYASGADRIAQHRTPITDGAYAEPWVFRAKDLRNWWSRAHHNRPGGVRAGSPTAWTPESKPIRLIEFGCPAVDKGANSPNLFVDPKSSESFLPPFSTGVRDDLGQRTALEAVLGYYADPAHNPVSSVYGEPMIAGMQVWCWDARPYPDFPARGRVWADAGNWLLGHWLTGRLGLSPLAALIQAIGARAGVDIQIEDISGSVTGYVIDRPMRVRDSLAPLSTAFAFDPAERGEAVAMVGRQGPPALELALDELALGEEGSAPRTDQRVLETPADRLHLRFIDGLGDYRTGALSLRREIATGGGEDSLDLPMVLSGAEAESLGLGYLARQLSARDQASLKLGPLAALKLEPADRISIEGDERTWRVERVSLDETPSVSLTPLEPPAPTPGADPGWTPGPIAPALGPSVLHLLDLPLLPGAENDIRPLAAIAVDPWSPRDLAAGPSVAVLTPRGSASQPASLGVTLEDLPSGPLYRLDQASPLSLRIEGISLQSRPLAAVLAGANALAVKTGEDWEIIQFLHAEQTDADVWTLSGLLRGQQGSEGAMVPLLAAGAPVVVLDDALVRAKMSLSERGLPYVWRAYPAGGPASGPGMSEAGFAWRAVSLRPLAPCQMRVRRAGSDLAISWVRRTRISGDSWEGEVPLGEAAETYRLEILDGLDVVRTLTVNTPSAVYTAAQQASDFPGGTPNPLSLRVRQDSDIVGWGGAFARQLGY